MVGSCGTTLVQALRELDEESGIPCPHQHFHSEDGEEYCMRCGIARDCIGVAE